MRASKFERLVVREFERVDGIGFNDVLGERLHLAALAVHAIRHSALPLNVHRIINVNRLAIENISPSNSLRNGFESSSPILNEFLTQLRTENVSVSIDDASGGFKLSHLELLEMGMVLGIVPVRSRYIDQTLRAARLVAVLT
jgi:hypothetical protein